MDRSDRMNRDLYEHIRSLMRPCVKKDGGGLEYYTAYENGALRDWNAYFDGIVALYMGCGTQLLRNAVRLFLQAQREDGCVPRRILAADGDVVPGVPCKPFLAQTIVLCWLYDGRLDWFDDGMYEQMRNYLLSYGSTGSVELGCFLFRDLSAFSMLADLRGREEDAERFEQLASERKANVLSLWNEADGFFYDRNLQTGGTIREKTLAGFLPMWAGIAAPRQAQILAYDHMLNPSEFYRNYPLAVRAVETSDATDPTVWISYNYLCMHGLMNYGYDGLAELLAYKTAELLAKSHDREAYSAETGRGAGQKPFAGWSLLGYFMPMEALEGFDPTALDVLPEETGEYMPYFHLPPVIEL